MRWDGRLTGYLLRVRESFEEWKNRSALEFEIHEGFRRSFGWISLGSLYTWEGDQQQFFTLSLVLLPLSLPLLSQPERVDREKRKTACLLPSAFSALARRWLTRRPSFRRATRGLSPPSLRRICRPLLPRVCSVLSPAGRSLSGWPLGARPNRLRRRDTWSVSPPSMSGGLGCRRVASCGRSHTTMGWSCITSTPTPSRRRPFSWRFARGFWGLTPTRTCGPISFARSFLLRRRT
jgi:hypothetical protein